jgi:hypothetical protein
MKKDPALIILALLSITACSSVPVEAAFAQCVIESYSETGENFQKQNTSKTDADAAYRNWMLLCMQAKGFEYDAKKCPPAKDGGFQSSEVGCYGEM